MFARNNVDARGRVRRELRIEVGEDVELRVERVRDRHVVLVAARPVERRAPGTRSRSSTLIPRAANTASSLLAEVVADDAHHRDVGEEARREREVGRRSAEHPFALSERGLERVEGDGSDDGDGHAVADTTGCGGFPADLALRRDRPLLGRVQHRRARRSSTSGASSSGGQPALDVACGTGRLLIPWLKAGSTSTAWTSPRTCSRSRASAPRARDCRRRSTPSRCTSSTFLAATGRSSSAAGSASGANREHDQQALERFHAHLEPGGTLVFDNEVPYASGASGTTGPSSRSCPRSWRPPR